MINILKNRLFIVCSLIFIFCMSFILINNVKATENSITYSDSNMFSGPFLSDLTYEPESKSGWKDIYLDKNPDNLPIALLKDGETILFSKGIAAHATSKIVYDLEKYKDYTHLFTYLGLDMRQNGKGDGASFKISVSNDKSEWKVIYTSPTLYSNKDAIPVDLNLEGYRYLCLEALAGKTNSSDHTVYAQARLHKANEQVINYFPSEAVVRQAILTYLNKGVEPAELNSDTLEFVDNVSDDSVALSELIWKQQFLKSVGTTTLNLLYENGYADALKYLWNNPYALRMFMGFDNVDKDGTYLQAVQAFAKIYNRYPDIIKRTDANNFYFRLAVSVAHAFGRESMVRFWEKPDNGSDPVTRFEVYVSLVESKIMDYAGRSFEQAEDSNVGRLGNGPLKTPTFNLPDTLNSYNVGDKTASGDKKLEEAADSYRWSTNSFVDLPLPLMKWVVDARMNDDEFAWLADYAFSKNVKNWNSKFDAYTYIRYTMGYNYGKTQYYDINNKDVYNQKYNFEPYFQNYETSVRRLWRVFEEGSVCGGLAKTYANLAEVFGRPSAVTAQPGHAATLTYVWNKDIKRYIWTIQNNISGWPGSNNEFNYKLLNWGNDSVTTWMNASYTPMATDAIYISNKLIRANEYLALSSFVDDNNKKEELLKKALSEVPYHEKAYISLINLYNNSNKTSAQYLELAKKIISDFAYYPLPMVDMLKRIESKITEVEDTIQVRLLKQQALEKAKVATTKEVYQPDICVAMAKNLLGQNNTPFATFSFDGEQAGKIVLDEQYRGSSIRLRYSLDNGKSWKETNEQIVTLTDDEINSITPETDITVGLVGTEAVHKLDILPGKTISAKTLVQNEWENRLVGDTQALQYRFSDDEPWKDYDDNVRFNGSMLVKVRYRATGMNVASSPNQYTFKEDAELNEKEKYITIDHLSLGGYSSQQSDTKDHAAKNMLDGNPLTAWHTEFKANNDERYHIVQLDKQYFISAIDYMPGGQNGRIKKIEIYTSLDGNEFTLVHTQDNLPNSSAVSHISFTPTEAKYVKIVGVETYGNSDGEKNKYMSGKLFNYYEDSTQVSIQEDPTISYEPATLTNQNVTATLVLPKGYKADVVEKVFDDNGSFEFVYTDKYGVEKRINANVSWIDKQPPVATLTYTPETETDGTVCVGIKDFSDDLFKVEGFPSVLNSENNTNLSSDDVLVAYDNFDKLCSIFYENETRTFTLYDKAGNKTELVADVTWIIKHNNTEIDTSTPEEGGTDDNVPTPDTGEGGTDNNVPTPDTGEGGTDNNVPAPDTGEGGADNVSTPDTDVDDTSSDDNDDEKEDDNGIASEPIAPSITDDSIVDRIWAEMNGFSVLLTAEDKKLKLYVGNTNLDEEYRKILSDRFGNISEIYEIKLIDDTGKEIQPTNNVVVRIPWAINKGIVDKIIHIYDENGNLINHSVTFKQTDSYLEFTVKHFSNFAIKLKNSSVDDVDKILPKTNVIPGVFNWVNMLILFTIILFIYTKFIFINKNKRQ